MATWKAPFLKGRISPVLFLVPSGKTHIFICTQMNTVYKKNTMLQSTEQKCLLYISYIRQHFIYPYLHLNLFLKTRFNFPCCNLYIHVFALFVILFISLHQVTRQDKNYAQFPIGHTTAIWC
jgi:hypothetical protein